MIKGIYNFWEEFEVYEDMWVATLNHIGQEVKDSLLPENSTNKKVMKKFFGKLFELKLQELDHIWLYLLNNLVGIRLVLLRMKMDLILIIGYNN